MNTPGKYDKYGSPGSPLREQAIISDLEGQIGPQMVAIYKNHVLLNNQQIKATSIAPTEVVPPVDGSVILPILFTFSNKIFDGYGNIIDDNSSILYFSYGADDNKRISPQKENVSSILNIGEIHTMPSLIGSEIMQLSPTDVIGVGVYFHVFTNAGIELSDGNPDNEITITTLYQVVEV